MSTLCPSDRPALAAELGSLARLKNELSAPTVRALVARVDNDAVREVLEGIVRDAQAQRESLLTALVEWSRPAPAPRPAGIAYRDIVEEWLALTLASARRTRALAERAPTPALHARLRALAEGDEAHAHALRGLL